MYLRNPRLGLRLRRTRSLLRSCIAEASLRRSISVGNIRYPDREAGAGRRGTCGREVSSDGMQRLADDKRHVAASEESFVYNSDSRTLEGES